MGKKKRPDVTATRPGHGPKKEIHENGNNYTKNAKGCQVERRRTRTEEEQKGLPGFWAVLPAQIRYDPEIPANAKLLYAEISALTDRSGFCFASNAYFMRLYGISERTLQSHLRILTARGFIRIENGDGGCGRRRIYAGINPLAQNPAENCGVTPQKIAGIPAENCGDNSKSRTEKKNNPPKAPQGAGEIWDPEAFERFWKLYPKKKDRKSAIREWNKLRADRNLMKTMTAALRRQMASEEWLRDDGRAIPYPCRWISHRRWEDEDIVPAAAPSAPRREAELWI